MAGRQILIEVRGEGGQYEAAITRMTEKNNQFSKAAVQGAQQTMSAFTGLTASLSGLPSLLGNIAGAMGLAFGVGAVVSFVKSAVTGVAALQDLSDQSGITATNLAALKLAGIASGQGIEESVAAVIKLQRTLITNHREGTDPTNKGLAALKLSAKELAASLADPNKLIEIFSQKLAAVSNKAELNAIAIDIASKSGAKFAATLLDLAANQEKYRQSVGLTNEQIKNLDAQLDKSAQAWEVLKFHMAGAAVELAKWLGLLKFTETDKLNSALQANSAVVVKLRRELDAARETVEKGSSPYKFEQQIIEKLKASIPVLEKQLAMQMKVREMIEKEQKALDVKPNLPPPSAPVIENKNLGKQIDAIEQAKTKLAQLKLAEAEAARAAGDLNVEVLALSLALIEQERAAQLAAIAHDKQLTPAIRATLKAIIDEETQIKLGIATRADAAKRQVEENKRIEESYASRLAMEDRNRENQEADLDYLKKSLALKEQLGEFQIQRMQAAGLPENVVLAEQVRLLQERRAALGAQGNTADSLKEQGLLDQQIELARIRLLKLQDTSIDVAGEVARTVTDITQAIINGTLKWADIGKSSLASFVRVALQQFTGFLQRMQQTAQSTQLLSGAAIQSGGTTNSGGGGGFMQSIMNMFSGGGGGGGGSGGGGGGGFLQGLMSMFSGGGGSFGVGSRPAGVAGPAMANGGFFGGGGLGAGISGMLDSGGGMLGGLMGGFFGSGGGPLGVGGQILGSVGSTILTSSLSAMMGGAGGLLGTLFPALLPLLSNPITAIIGAIIIAITSILGAQKVNPTVQVRSQIEGFLYSELENQFKAGTVISKAKGTDIPQSVVNSTRDQVQNLLEGLSKQWTAILNLFPVIVHKDMIPKLEAANKLLNVFFGKLKFSEGGSNTIQQEIARLAGRTGPEGFFHALRGVIGAGLTASIKQAGLGDLSELVNKTFAESDPNSTFASIRTGPGLKAPQLQKDVQPFFEAIGKFVGLTSGLAGVSKSGITPFLTEQDLARTTSQISDVLKITDGKQFTAAVDQLEAELKPVLEFLQKSVQETTSLFSRGMIAALEAVSESGAIQAFNKNLGEGVKSMIFQGITEAFIASAQFNDLLAPIQQTIREFTQQAINSGEAPDIDAFRRAILPDVEDITMRAEMLGPLLAELQKLGIDVKDALKALTGSVTAGKIEINFSGAVSVRSEADIEDISRRLASLISGALPPV